MQLSDDGLQFIADFEGFIAHLYNDPAGHCTIGYGHLVHRGACDGHRSEVPFIGSITQIKALRLLEADVQRFEECISTRVRVPLNQNRFDALVSFAFNVGCGAFESSTLLRKLNNGEYHRVCDELMLWVHGGGEVLPGLVRRREAECELFNRPYDPPLIIEEEEEVPSILVKKASSNRVLRTDGVSVFRIPSATVLHQLFALGMQKATVIQPELFDALWEAGE